MKMLNNETDSSTFFSLLLICLTLYKWWGTKTTNLRRDFGDKFTRGINDGKFL